MKSTDIAQSIFDRITSGHKNAIRRPDVIDKSNSSIDRALRELVEHANRNGDCIINAGFGYFRPNPLDEEDRAYFREYIKKEKTRNSETKEKLATMEYTYYTWRREAEWKE